MDDLEKKLEIQNLFDNKTLQLGLKGTLSEMIDSYLYLKESVMESDLLKLVVVTPVRERSLSQKVIRKWKIGFTSKFFERYFKGNWIDAFTQYAVDLSNETPEDCSYC